MRVKVTVPGKPTIWLGDSECERCRPYNKCLGFDNLTEEEWLEVQGILVEAKELVVAINQIGKEYILKEC